MSYQLKDKKKIQNLRKSLQTISQHTPRIKIHFAKDHIRFFTEVDESTVNMLDLMASFFSKFIAPECLQSNNILQITVDRDVLLHSFNAIDDTELDFSVNITDPNYGVLKILKTRELFLIQASCPFSIDQVVSQQDSYEFPDNQLLMKTQPKNLKTIKSLFSQKDCMTLKFQPEMLTFQDATEGDASVFEINAKSLRDANSSFGVYISREQSQMASCFVVSLMYKHMSGLVKIADYIEGQVSMAMETIADNAAVVFLFTKGRDVQYTVGVSNVKFENQDSLPQYTQPQPQLQRLKKTDNQPEAQAVQEPARIKVEQSRPATTVKQSPSKQQIETPAQQAPPEQVQEQPEAAPMQEQEDDDAALARKIKKQNFYKEVDEEEFF